MSLSWRDRVIVGLAPLRLRLWRDPAPWPHRTAAPASIPCSVDANREPWQSVLAALTQALEKPEWQNAPLQVVLSDQFVRYQILPWEKGLSHDAERLAYARFHFNRVYGEAADGWEIATSDEPPGCGAVACAIDRTLLQALRDLCAARRTRLHSVQPRFVALYNAVRRRLNGAETGLAAFEPGRLTVGLIKRARVVSLTTRAIDGAPGEALTALLDEAALQGDEPHATADLFVLGAAAQPVGGNWRVQALPPSPAIATLTWET